MLVAVRRLVYDCPWKGEKLTTLVPRLILSDWVSALTESLNEAWNAVFIVSKVTPLILTPLKMRALTYRKDEADNTQTQ